MSQKSVYSNPVTAADSVFSPMDSYHSASPRRPLMRESDERYIFYGNWSRGELLDQALRLGMQVEADIHRDQLIALLEKRNATVARRRYR